MTVEIRVAQNKDAMEWDNLITQSAHGTLFHHWDWLKITEKHTGTQLYPLFGIKNGVPVGVFPVFFQRIGTTKMAFSPPPHAALFFLGPVLAGYDTLKQEKRENIYSDFQNSIENFIKNELRANYIYISLSPGLQDPRPFIWSGYSIEPLYDYEIDLTQGSEFLLRTLDKKQRQDINRAKRRGIMIEVGQKTDFDKILDLMELRYEQQGKVVTVSRSYLTDIFNTYKQNITVFVAKQGGEIVTGLIDLHYKDTNYSWIGNLKPIIQISPSPTDLLYWEDVCYCIEHGFKYYTVLGAAGDNRLHSYYAEKFNPKLNIRFLAKKTAFSSSIFERGYTNILKPLKGRMMHHISEV
jgi:hypothetical protein